MRRRAALLLTTCAGVLAGVALVPAAQGSSAPAAAVYRIGFASESINPEPGMLTKGLHLGGYGFGSTDFVGHRLPDPAGINRDAVGSLGSDGHGAHTRAMAVSDGRRAIVLAQVDVQGYFAAYKQGPFGIADVRRAAAAQISRLGGPAVGAGQILVDSNHSHSGADLVGVWGGVPTSYLKLVFARTVQAIVRAYQSLRPATLHYGVAHAGVEGQTDLYPAPTGDPLLTNQFRSDKRNLAVDDELRVIQARDPETGAVIGTYLNFSAHTTVLGASNRHMSADYTGAVSDQLAQRFGGWGFDQVATLGRTQPARSGCPDRTLEGVAQSRCALEQYATRVVDRVQLAVDAAQPITGAPVVDMHSYLMNDAGTNAILIAGGLGGYAVGMPVYRAMTPPWFTGNVVGTTSFSGRIGDVLISGGPGEMYPQIVHEVRRVVPGMRGYLSVGTAGDFLGYIVAPYRAYPEPIRRSFFDGAPPPDGSQCSGVPSPIGCPDPVSNDNYIFNVSHTFGERLTCSFLRGAGDVLKGNARAYWSERSRCLPFADDVAKPADLDTRFPAGPDLSHVLTH